MTGHIGDLPHAIEDGDELDWHLAGKTPAVFLDYDGTLTPIVDRRRTHSSPRRITCKGPWGLSGLAP